MKSEKGFSLIEVLVATALLGILGVGVLATLGTVTKVLIINDQHQTAMNLAQAQMDFVQESSYATTYPTVLLAETDYPDSMEVATVAEHVPGRDANIQKITVTVTRTSDGKVIFVLEDYKVK